MAQQNRTFEEDKHTQQGHFILLNLSTKLKRGGISINKNNSEKQTMECRNERVAKTVYNTRFMFADGKSNIFLSEHFHLNFISLTSQGLKAP